MFIAIDWGTTRLRAYLIGPDGDVLDRSSSDTGIQSVPPGGFPAALAKACGGWFSTQPDLPVIMAGMVGSRNGWAEASYVPPPCGSADLAASLLPVHDTGRPVFIIPGVDCRASDGSYDVMRGEETQVFGADMMDGLICLPGTHSKWVEVAGGRITRFATFVTGEVYAALSQSFVGRLAQEPDDLESGGALARTLGALEGGLTRTLFQARTQVLAGHMAGHAVRPFLSSLLIDSEIRGARDLFGAGKKLQLVAGHPQRDPYAAALSYHGYATEILEPEATTVAGLVRIAALSGLV